ncbi:transposase [Cupriavidus gilardii CR3]|nr:transposase [Cupriavidus gilardii CR3]
MQKEAIPLSRACLALGVSRAGYYAFLRRPGGDAKRTRQMVYVRAAFEASGRTYGSRRVARDVSRQGVKIGRYRARTLMRQAHLRPVWKRKFVATTTCMVDMPIKLSRSRWLNTCASNLPDSAMMAISSGRFVMSTRP